MRVLTLLLEWLNAAANAVGGFLLSPVGSITGWLSATIVAAVTGVVLLVFFKYTSNQVAIKKVRADIKANLLALKLFKDSALVALQAQKNILIAAAWLMIYAFVPIIVMFVPVLLVLSQIGLWYQYRPLRVHEKNITLTVELNGAPDSAMPDVQLEPNSGFKTTIGPVHILSERKICWYIVPESPGYQTITIRVGDQTYDKELAVGDNIMRVSKMRPGEKIMDVLLNPMEKPFGGDSPVQSIDIAYPKRDSWTCGTDKWVYYWFIISMVSAFCFRGVFKVNI